MSDEMVASPACGPLFEINLLGDQVPRLKRKYALRKLARAGGLALFVAAAVFAILAAIHMASAMHRTMILSAATEKFVEKKRTCQDLDQQRAGVVQLVQPLMPYMCLLQTRVAWTSKLHAMALALPPDTGIDSINASAGNLFPDSKTGGSSGGDAARRLSFVTVSRVSSEAEIAPIIYLEKLHLAPSFMTGFSNIRLESTEWDNLKGEPVLVLRGAAW